MTNEEEEARPWHLKPGMTELMDGYWNKIPMVPLHLEFDDDSAIGQRVCAWVRPEDVWRFTNERPMGIPSEVAAWVRAEFGTAPPQA